MNQTKIIYLVALILMAFNVHSQWNPCLGIEGSDVKDMTIYDSSLYLVSGGAGVFKKGINEQDWSENILPSNIYKIRATDQALFCLGYYSFYRSPDGGITWDQLESPSSGNDIETTDSAVFLTTGEGVLRSFD